MVRVAARCLFRVARGSLNVVCCSLCAAGLIRCSVRIVRCSLFLGYGLLPYVCCVLFAVRCVLSFVVC